MTKGELRLLRIAVEAQDAVEEMEIKYPQTKKNMDLRAMVANVLERHAIQGRLTTVDEAVAEAISLMPKKAKRKGKR